MPKTKSTKSKGAKKSVKKSTKASKSSKAKAKKQTKATKSAKTAKTTKATKPVPQTVVDKIISQPQEARAYEMVVILKPFLPDNVRVKTDKQIVDLVEQNKGKVEKKDIWGKKYLAYKIKGHNEGYYIVYKIKLEAKKVAEVTKQLNLYPDIMRFLIMS